jgi:hypothetical protein
LKFRPQPAYNRFMSKPFVKTALLVRAALLVAVAVAATATNALAQTHRRHDHGPSDTDRPAPAVPADKRDSAVAAPGPYTGRPYWLALAQCGGIYFKLNVLYTDIAVHARVTKPDPTLNNEVTKKLNDAIKTATVFFTAAERFLMNDRGIERTDAVLVYNEQARAAGDRIKGADDNAAIIAGLSAAKACPTLYQACQAAYPKACSEQLAPVS